MKLINTLHKILIESNQELIDILIDENYYIDSEIKYNFLYETYLVTIRLIPKSEEAKKLERFPIEVFSSTKMVKNEPRIIETNSAYNEGGMFSVLGLTDELHTWLLNKTKKITQQNHESNNSF